MQISFLSIALSVLYALPSTIASPVPHSTTAISPVELVDGKANGTVYSLDTSSGKVGHRDNRYWQWVIADPATGNDLIYDNAMGGPTGYAPRCKITEGNKFTCVGTKSDKQTYFGICQDCKIRLTETPLQSPCSSAFSLVAVAP